MTTLFLPPDKEQRAKQGMEAPLAAQVEVAVRGRTWSYVLRNNEPAGSPHFVKVFQLDVAAPFTVTGTPPGWDFQTDNRSFVLWFNTDEQLPHPNDVAPGASRDGFQIQTTRSARFWSKGSHETASPYGLTAWDHDADAASRVMFGTTLAPSSVPGVA